MTEPKQPDDSAPASEASSGEAADKAARRPRRRRTPKVDAEGGAPAAAAVDAAEPQEGAQEPRSSTSSGAQGGDSSAESTQAESTSGPASDDGGEPRRKRHRNRRRNRRGGQRGAEGDVDAEGSEQGLAGAGSEPLPPPANLPATDVNELFADVLSGLYDAAAEASIDAVAAVDTSGAAPRADLVAAADAPVLDLDLSLPDIGAAAATPVMDSEPPAQSQAAGADGIGEAGEADESIESAGQSQPVADQARPEHGRRVLLPDADAPKLQKVLAQSGVGSRRDLEQMIADSRVMVNGQAAHVGQRIRAGDRITVDGKPIRVRIKPLAPRVLAYHKPVGEVVTHDDPQARPTVFRRLPRLPHGKWQSVGRLDINTEGLLLFTNSGDLANRLMHPRFGVEREYAVRVLGTLTEDEREQLLQGVSIDGQTAAFSSIVDGGGEGVNHWYRVVITEGRNREVRKLFDSVHKAVSRLIRIRYGSVVLPRGLRRGVWVDLGADDLKALQEATGMPARNAQGPRGSNAQRDRGPREARDMRDTRGGQGPDDRRGSKRGGGGGNRGRDGRRGEGPMPGGGQGQRRERGFAAPDYGDNEHLDNIGPIPDPLQQTYDKRAFQQSRQRPRELGDDSPIPNPLQQTYDKRAIQSERRPQREYSEDGPIPNPLQQTYDKRFASSPKSGGGNPGGGGGGGRGRRNTGQAPRKSASGGQPDPMRTAVGYIGGDAFHNKQRGGGGGRGGRGGPKQSGGGGRGRSGGGGGSGGGGR